MYKARDINNGEWVNGFLVKLGVGFAIIPDYANTTEELGCNVVMVDKDTICMRTGFTDKHGNQIYSGDIVKYSDKNKHDNNEMTNACMVSFLQVEGVFGDHVKDEDGLSAWGWDEFMGVQDHEMWWRENSEVVGNIMDDDCSLDVNKEVAQYINQWYLKC